MRRTSLAIALCLASGLVHAQATDASRTLARAMTLGLGPNSGRVVEFGPGTGRFTEAILARGVRPGWTSWGDQANEDYKPTWPTYQNNSGRETFDKEKGMALFERRIQT